MNSIADNIKILMDEIKQTAQQCGRSPEDVRLIAVSKTHPPEMVQEAFESGHSLFGENKIQEADKKIESLHSLPIEWHFIGHVQTNKAKKAVSLFSMIHTIDSVRLINALEKEAKKIGKTIDILLQINVAQEESKFGAGVEELENLLAAYQETSHLVCHGLMTVPPYCDNPEEVRPYFAQLRELGERYRTELVPPGEKLELSMGMSHDFKTAIEEGATFVRIGTAVFGQRYY